MRVLRNRLQMRSPLLNKSSLLTQNSPTVSDRTDRSGFICWNNLWRRGCVPKSKDGVEVGKMNSQTTHRTFSSNAHETTRRLVLCIDDDPTSVLLRKCLLQQAGYDVIGCVTAKVGLRVFSTIEVHAVVVDYSMPELNGVEVAKSMRRLKPEVPIIMLSGHPIPPGDVDSTVDEYVVKGVPPEILLDKIGQLLNRAEQRRTPGLQAA